VDDTEARHRLLDAWRSEIEAGLIYRLQARLAPLERVLASRETAEEVEIEDRYRRPTGDVLTDELLADIRKDEKSHSLRSRR
jgi:hypothetical protein